MLKPFREALGAARRSVDKKISEAEKRAQKGSEDGGSIEFELKVIAQALEKIEGTLPHSILDVDDACNLSGANLVELLKKVRQATKLRTTTLV